MYKLGILGVGKMGGAILSGILKANMYNKDEILLFVHSDAKYDQFSKDGFHVTKDASDLFREAKAILLAVKPQMFPEVLAPAKELSFDGRLIMSIAAGLSISYIEQYFKGATIVRAMPNTPAQIGAGVTTLVRGNAKEEEFKILENIFNSIGVAYEITEAQMDDSLPLNGSMPAYFDYFAKGFIDAAVEAGIDYETAKKLTAESIISSAKLLLESQESIDTLIENVCSKGGTTIAGLNKLKENNFLKAVTECHKACADRSRELAK